MESELIQRLSMTDDFFDTGKRVRKLLEDFEVVSTSAYMALIPTMAKSDIFRENVQTVVLASTLRLNSLDYTKKKYVANSNLPNQKKETDYYISAYKLAKHHIEVAMATLETESRPKPSFGVFRASVALERLVSSFFSTHVLYSLGNAYEGHAVARLILEQIGWAYQAAPLDNLEEIKAIKTTKSISRLTSFYPNAGKLYGFLSKKTHIDYDSHHEFIKIEDDRNVVVLGQDRTAEYAKVLLVLADIFVAVWEFSQYDYLPSVESVEKKDNNIILRTDRPFREKLNNVMDKFNE